MYIVDEDVVDIVFYITLVLGESVWMWDKVPKTVGSLSAKRGVSERGGIKNGGPSYYTVGKYLVAC